ncbi:MAG TPA: glycosyltransferase family 1 protein [Bryobacteraceae bacterium]|nr:glycosyltransferase family 1 protein [Bryobacteraceae bacterium]
MRIAVDATSLLLRSAGVKSYTYHWLNALRRIAGKDDIRAFPFIGTTGELDHDRSMLPMWATYPRLAILYGVNLGGPPALEACLEGADIFHASNQIHHAPKKALLTATVHDLTCWKLPELHTKANVEADQRFAERILKRAHGLIAVSEATRQDAMDLLDIPEERIVTIHSGVSDSFFQVNVGDVLELKELAGLRKPYVLFVGTIEPRKNLDRLLDAWLGLKPSLREEFELVIAGPSGWAPETARRLSAGAAGVRMLGYVAEDALPALTAGALLFVYPSLYEGFGFPVAQAMAAGVPVLTSNISALPEITGDAAELVDPLSVTEIREALERLLTSRSLLEEMAVRGKERAQSYRWSKCARRSLQFFERTS